MSLFPNAVPVPSLTYTQYQAFTYDQNFTLMSPPTLSHYFKNVVNKNHLKGLAKPFLKR